MNKNCENQESAESFAASLHTVRGGTRMGGEDFFKTTDELDSSDGRVGGQKSVQTISLKRGDDKP